MPKEALPRRRGVYDLLPPRLEHRIRKAMSRSLGDNWRLKSLHQILPDSGLMVFCLIPPANSVAYKEKWACEPRTYNFRSQFLISVPNWFDDIRAEAHSNRSKVANKG